MSSKKNNNNLWFLLKHLNHFSVIIPTYVSCLDHQTSWLVILTAVHLGAESNPTIKSRLHSGEKVLLFCEKIFVPKQMPLFGRIFPTARLCLNLLMAKVDF